MKYNRLIPLAFFLLLIASPVYAAVTQACVDNATLRINQTYYVNNDGTQTEIWIANDEPCPFGCSDGKCDGSNIESESMGVWLTYGTGAILLILGTAMGLLARKQTDPNDESRGFDLTMVARYMFFFIGLFLLYMSYGMANRLGIVYGMESNVTSSLNTTGIVILITILLFLFMFSLEVLVLALRYFKESGRQKKREDYGED